MKVRTTRLKNAFANNPVNQEIERFRERVPAPTRSSALNDAFKAVATVCFVPVLPFALALRKFQSEEFQKNYVSNPVTLETVRFKSRFFKPTSSDSTNRAIVGAILFFYAVCLVMLAAARLEGAFAYILGLQAALIMICAPVAAHSSLAGERDARSWEVLQTAPITQKQIVFGKFKSLVNLVLGVSMAMLPAVLISVLSNMRGFALPSLVGILMAELITIASGLALAAFGLWVSSRAKNSNAALATSVGSCVGVFVVLPAAIVYLAGSNAGLPIALLIWHPIVALLMQLGAFPDQLALLILTGLPTLALYLTITYIFLRKTVKVLNKSKLE